VVTLASVTVDSVTEDSVTVATDVVEFTGAVVGETVVNAGTVPVTVWSAIVAAVVELLGTVVDGAVSEGDAGAGAAVGVASGESATAVAVEASRAGSGAGTMAQMAATGKGMPSTPTTAIADMRRCDGPTLCLRSYAFVHSPQLY
jgi:hypothetical protein